MLKPTQDKELRAITIKLFSRYGIFPGFKDAEVLLDELFTELEKLGYHKDLPPSIEEAPNSGDRIYKS